ncbi:hypothetical protein CP082626L3_1093B, partial [Chlamydia psittaci 08-2626_L3]
MCEFEALELSTSISTSQITRGEWSPPIRSMPICTFIAQIFCYFFSTVITAFPL